MAVERFRVRNAFVEAIRWTGDNEMACHEFADGFDVADPDSPWDDDPEATASVLETVHNTWEFLYTGDWIVRHAGGVVRRWRAAEFAEQFEAAMPVMVPLEVDRERLEAVLRNMGPQLIVQPPEMSIESTRPDGMRVAEQIATAFEALCPDLDVEHAGGHCDYRAAAAKAREIGGTPNG